jgi:uncharacterized protein
MIALEEHLVTPEVVAAWRALPAARQDLALAHSTDGDGGHRLQDLGEERIATMDAEGINVQVLSLTSPGVQNLDPGPAVDLARDVNDRIAAAVRHRPDRFQGFATLPTPAPEQAAAELERAVHTLGLDGALLFGRTGERNFDSEEFRPIFESAEALRAPLYLHPQSPQVAVRSAYYDGLGDAVDAAFATFGLGWHFETGIQLLRLILAGVLDRYPGLQLIVGHWGEVVLFYLERLAPLAGAAKLRRPLAEYFTTNVFITPSGMMSPRYLRWALETVGSARIMMATDYPFVMPEPGAAAALLAGLEPGERDAIASGNWNALRSRIRR